jgi:hypothetical protein
VLLENDRLFSHFDCLYVILVVERELELPVEGKEIAHEGMK